MSETNDAVPVSDHAAFDLQPGGNTFVENVVIKALVAEYLRLRTKIRGAEQRLAFAKSQLESEAALLEEFNSDNLLLTTAITNFGGQIPPEDQVQ